MAGVRGRSVFKLGSLRFSFSYNATKSKRTKNIPRAEDSLLMEVLLSSIIVKRNCVFNN